MPCVFRGCGLAALGRFLGEWMMITGCTEENIGIVCERPPTERLVAPRHLSVVWDTWSTVLYGLRTSAPALPLKGIIFRSVYLV